MCSVVECVCACYFVSIGCGVSFSVCVCVCVHIGVVYIGHDVYYSVCIVCLCCPRQGIICVYLQCGVCV